MNLGLYILNQYSCVFLFSWRAPTNARIVINRKILMLVLMEWCLLNANIIIVNLSQWTVLFATIRKNISAVSVKLLTVRCLATSSTKTIAGGYRPKKRRVFEFRRRPSSKRTTFLIRNWEYHSISWKGWQKIEKLRICWRTLFSEKNYCRLTIANKGWLKCSIRWNLRNSESFLTFWWKSCLRVKTDLSDFNANFIYEMEIDNGLYYLIFWF